jgi:hypothetical protein
VDRPIAALCSGSAELLVTVRQQVSQNVGAVRPVISLDDAHARLIVIYACNIRRDRAPPRRASVRIFQNALPTSVDRTAPSRVHRDLMPAALGCRESKFVVK